MLSTSAARVLGGSAAMAGGGLWAVKGLAILIVDQQPALVFESAPTAFGVAVLALAMTENLRDRRKKVAVLLAVASTVAALVTLVSALETGSVLGPDILVATMAQLGALILVGLASRGGAESSRPGAVALAIGLSTIPALLVGGLLALVNERLLELPLLVLALMWILLGCFMLSNDRNLWMALGLVTRWGAPSRG